MAERDLYYGSVKEVDAETGKVRVQRLDQSGDVKLPWVRVMMPFGGDGTGFMMLPENEDLAVVGYCGTEPLVLGFVYRARDERASDAVGTRRIKSKDGHTVTFFDGDNSGITIEDANGNLIEMTKEGITIKSKGKILLEASGTTTVKGSTVELNP